MAAGERRRGWFAPPGNVERRSDSAAVIESDERDQLALAARAGDRRALELLIEGTQGDVWRFCAHLADRSRAADLTQETYLRAIPSLARFRGDSSVMTWLLSIARRVVADELRREGRRARLHGRLVREPIVEAGSSSGAEWASYLDVLDADRRAAFVVTQVLGYSYADAARVLGCPVGTVRSRVSRARAVLLDSLAGGAAGEGAVSDG
jgi:RNA polymerase sigma-70 factor (ECF subfamily)